MKRLSKAAAQSIFCCLLLAASASAASFRGGVRPLPGRAATPRLDPSLTRARLAAPALPGAIPNITGGMPGALAEDPSARPAALPAGEDGAPARAALDSARELSGRVAGDEEAGGDAAARASEAFFSQAVERGGAPEAPVDAADLERAGSMRPRLVFLLDVFTGPISDRFARYVDSMVDKGGVQLVLVTDRSEAEISELVLSKLKARRANGVVVVSNNGGKIFAYDNSRSLSHKPLVDTDAGFPERALKAFAAQNKAVAGKFGIEPPAETRHEDGKGRDVRVLSYSLALPAALSEPVSKKTGELKADRWLAEMNKRLKGAGVPYTFALHVDGAGRLSAVTHSTPLRGSLGRIRRALKDAMNDQDFLVEHPDKAVVIADPEWWKTFQNQPELAGVNFLGAKTEAQAEAQIGAMLGDRAMERAYIDRYKLESYMRWKRSRAFAQEGENHDAPAPGNVRGGRELGGLYLHRAIVMSKVMELIGMELLEGRWQTLRPGTLDGIIAQMWKGRPVKVGGKTYMPFQNAFVEAGRSQAFWREHSRGHLEYTQRFARKIVERLLPNGFADFREVGATVHRVGALGALRAELPNPVTGRVLEIGMRVPLSRIENTPEGRTMYLHVPRTGRRDPYIDRATAHILAAGAFGADKVKVKADGSWEESYRRLDRIVVEFMYYGQVFTVIFKPSGYAGAVVHRDEIGFSHEDVRVLSNEGEKALADDEFNAEFEASMAERDSAKAKAAARAAEAAKAKASPARRKRR